MLYSDAKQIIDAALMAAQPDQAVSRALVDYSFANGRVVLVSIGKAAWQMARSACNILGRRISDGVVITKYGHGMGPLPGLLVFEAGHPVPDDNSFAATEQAISLVKDLCEQDTVLFLVSGGGSALFEKPLIDTAELEHITRQLLGCGSDIVEMNTLRKRLSAVKGGRFAQLCAPARVFSIVLSDIIGDPLDMIASGPAYPDQSTSEQAKAILRKYNISATDEVHTLLNHETPKRLDNVDTIITGSVGQLCRAARDICIKLGYEPHILTASLCCNARDAGSFLASIAQYHKYTEHSLAFIAGGETVVKLTGSGKGGRNQELALAAATGIDGLDGVAVFSVGSDGTDGPTDAAGGYADEHTKARLLEQGVDIHSVLENNDAYNALAKVDGLIITGPTGTNVNDLSVLLIKR